MKARGQEIVKAGEVTTPTMLERFATVSGLMADGTLRAAEEWRPDLVVHGRLALADNLIRPGGRPS